MAAQVQSSLFDISLYLHGKKPKKKRVRYKTPTYTKSYTFWHINPYTEEIEYDGDEKHIFRIRNLHNIYSLLYGYCDINIFEQFEKKDLAVYLSGNFPLVSVLTEALARDKKQQEEHSFDCVNLS